MEDAEQDGPEVAVASCDELGAVGHPPHDIGSVNAKIDDDFGLGSAKGLDSPPQLSPWHRLLAWHLSPKEVDVRDGEVVIAIGVKGKFAAPNATCDTILGILSGPPDPSE